MPLSEHEQRLLEEMERGLYQNDADFVATVGDRNSRPNYRWIVIGILVGILGIISIIIGVASQISIVGIAGFAIMFVGVLLALKRSAVPSVGQSPVDSKPYQRVGFMDRLNERWDKRQDERGH